MLSKYIKGINIDSNMLQYAKDVNKHIANNNDVVMALTGYRGCGKTLWAFLIKYLIEKRFTFDNVLFVPAIDKVKDVMDKSKQGEVILIDEAIKSTYKLDFMTGAVKYLYQRFQRERKFNRIVFLLQPSFHDFAKGFRDEIINSWMHIYERGEAIIFSRMDSRYNIDRWYLEEPKKEVAKIMKRKGFFSMQEQIKFDLKLPNSVYYVKFPKEQYKKLFVESGLEKQYLELSMKANLEAEDQYKLYESKASERMQLSHIKAIKTLAFGLELPASILSQIFGYSQTQILEYRNKDIKVKPFKIAMKMHNDVKNVMRFINENLVKNQNLQLGNHPNSPRIEKGLLYSQKWQNPTKTKLM